jgi:hypothetical protein
MNCRILFLTMTALAAVLLVVWLPIYFLRTKKQLKETEVVTKPSILLSSLPPLPPIVLPSLSTPPTPIPESSATPPAPAPPRVEAIPVAPPQEEKEAPTPSVGDVHDIPMFTPRHALIPG